MLRVGRRILTNRYSPKQMKKIKFRFDKLKKNYKQFFKLSIGMQQKRLKMYRYLIKIKNINEKIFKYQWNMKTEFGYTKKYEKI